MRCIKCKRPLSNPKSIYAGYGPVCLKIIGTKNKQYIAVDDENQVKLFDVPERADEEVTIKGYFENKKVFIESKQWPIMYLSPRQSLRVYNHSTEFNWGYSGSGPAQLALAILLEFTDKKTAITLHQTFKSEIIAGLNGADDFVLTMNVTKWIRKKQEYQIKPETENFAIAILRREFDNADTHSKRDLKTLERAIEILQKGEK